MIAGMDYTNTKTATLHAGHPYSLNIKLQTYEKER